MAPAKGRITRQFLSQHSRVIKGPVYAVKAAPFCRQLRAAVKANTFQGRKGKQQRGRFYADSVAFGPKSEPARLISRVEKLTGAKDLKW
jgi:hypothetical protein